MSAPHKVPNGWTKGELLIASESKTRHSLSRHVAFDVTKPLAEGDDIVLLFDTSSDMVEFIRWWFSGNAGVVHLPDCPKDTPLIRTDRVNGVGGLTLAGASFRECLDCESFELIQKPA